SLGGKFTVATGRGVPTSRFMSEMIQFECPIIVNGGQTFYDFYKDKIVYTENLPESSKYFVKILMEKFSKVGVEIYSGDKVFALRVNDVLINHLSYEKTSYINATLDEFFELDWQKVLFEDTFEDLAVVRKFAKENCPENIKLIDTNPKFMEFSNVGIDKGTAILKLADMYEIPYANVCAIGNYYNDIEMIEAAGIGAFVNDSPDEIKHIADYITDKTCKECGFAEFVEYIINL
ncbi:MAG: HAD hydrolase family protein, partial [Clostridia bacterium]|nr:HAD hydrolase family protein [Clostridia bacterium]